MKKMTNIPANFLGYVQQRRKRKKEREPRTKEEKVVGSFRLQREHGMTRKKLSKIKTLKKTIILNIPHQFKMSQKYII